jgi:hypothetical protein
MYTSVLLNNEEKLSDIFAAPASYLGTTGSFTGWHFDNHHLPSLNFHWGGAPAIWLVLFFFFFFFEVVCSRMYCIFFFFLFNEFPVPECLFGCQCLL